LVLEYRRTPARKIPIFLHLNNQLVAISLILLIVRFRTLYVQFYLTKTALPLAGLRLLNAGKWWFGPVDGFDVQMPYRIIRFL
jgi:hypothetical protein